MSPEQAARGSERQAASEFLAWAAGELGLDWQAFRRNRGQLYKRLRAHMQAVGVSDLRSYRDELSAGLRSMDGLQEVLRVTVSRFYRDAACFEALGQHYLLDLAKLRRAESLGQPCTLRLWSAGCASGEEAHSLMLLARTQLEARVPGLRCLVRGTDLDPVLLERARRAVYQGSSLRELPSELRAKAFEATDAGFRLRRAYACTDFEQLDIRRAWRDAAPPPCFDLICCRNLAFSYFDAEAQLQQLVRFKELAGPGAILVIGRGETLPGPAGVEVLDAELGIYRM